MFNPTVNTNGYEGAAGNFGFYWNAGYFAVTNFTVSAFCPKKIDVGIIGDSIGSYQAGATLPSYGWSRRTQSKLAALGLSTVILGCTSDRSIESSNELAELLKLPAPTMLLYADGGNDRPTPTFTNYYNTNLPGIKATYAALGTRVVWVSPTARGTVPGPSAGWDVSPLAYFMLTNNPRNFIDVYSATKYSSSASFAQNTNMWSPYNNPYESIHPNDAGHDAVEETVRAWLRQNGYWVQ
jgi:hypothetical protein